MKWRKAIGRPKAKRAILSDSSRHAGLSIADMCCAWTVQRSLPHRIHMRGRCDKCSKLHGEHIKITTEPVVIETNCCCGLEIGLGKRSNWIIYKLFARLNWLRYANFFSSTRPSCLHYIWNSWHLNHVFASAVYALVALLTMLKRNA